MNTEILARALGLKAKELVEGMRERVQRDPDVADFAAGFEPIIKAHREADDRYKKHEVLGRGRLGV